MGQSDEDLSTGTRPLLVDVRDTRPSVSGAVLLSVFPLPHETHLYPV